MELGYNGETAWLVTQIGPDILKYNHSPVGVPRDAQYPHDQILKGSM